VQYLLKPFTFASLREKLERYAEFRESVGQAGVVTGQADIDRAFATLRTSDQSTLPKGMSTQTLEAITAALAVAVDGLSAGAAATAIGASRVTARRYLEYLADNGLAQREPRYGQVGRPEVCYRPKS
jgi:response regulator of citrate/malate metabolism